MFRPMFIQQFEGLNEDENPHALADGELTVATNVWRRGRTTGTRPGTQFDQDDYTTAISGTPTIVGMVDWRARRNTQRQLLVMTPTNLYVEDGVSLNKTAITLTGASGDLWTFAQHKGIVYAAGGDLSTDITFYWDPTSAFDPGTVDAEHDLHVLTIPNLVGTHVKPRYIFEWSNYIFAGGFEINASNNDASAGPGIVRHSALNDGTSWPEENTFGGFSAVGGFSADGYEYDTGFASYQDNRGKFLLVLTNRAIYAVQQTGSAIVPFRISDKIANGCVSQHCYVNLGLDVGDGVYLSDQGIHSLRQSQAHGNREDAFLSFKIRKTFDRVNRSQLDKAVGAYWRERGLVLFAVPLDSSTKNNAILALDVRDITSGSALAPGRDLNAQNARWFLWELGDDANHHAAYLTEGQDSNNKWRIFGGNYKGEVFEFTEDLFSDMGASYTSRFRTKHYTLNAPYQRKILGDVVLDLQPGGDQRPKMVPVFDFGRRSGKQYALTMPSGSAIFGTAVFGTDKFSEADANIQKKVYVTGSGDSIGFEFEHTAANEPFYIAQIVANIDVMGETLDG